MNTSMARLLAHAFGDYGIQSDWMASEKTKRSLPAAAHALTYTACFLPLTRDWRRLAVIGGTHFVIDRWRLARHLAWAKNQLAPKAYRPGHTTTGYSVDKPPWLSFWLMILLDNSAHLLINELALTVRSK
jgi:hypothetical protein